MDPLLVGKKEGKPKEGLEQEAQPEEPENQGKPKRTLKFSSMRHQAQLAKGKTGCLHLAAQSPGELAEHCLPGSSVDIARWCTR